MNLNPDQRLCGQSDRTSAYALQALPASEVAAAKAHIAACPDCQGKLKNSQSASDKALSWPAPSSAEPSPAPRIWTWIGWTALVAVLAVLTVASLLVA